MKRSIGPSSVIVGFAVIALGACSTKDSGPAPATVAADAAVDAGPRKLAAQKFSDFEAWASPIDDYLAVGRKKFAGQFNTAITELMPFGERLFLGYGDGNVNLGKEVPIEMRFFASADDAAASAAPVDGEGQGAPQTKPTQTGEEQIDRFRVFDGELWQAGVDSIDEDELWTQALGEPKRIQGNVYRLDGDVVRKRRTVGGGEHVHDVASFKGDIYAVGSGADTRIEFEGGQVFRYLWRSRDRASSFETVTRVQYPEAGKGDSRFIHLLPTRDRLFAFGLESPFDQSKPSKIRSIGFDGQTVTEIASGDAVFNLFPDGTQPLADGSGLFWGVDITTKARNVTGRVGADGSFTRFEGFASFVTLDVALTDTGELVYLLVPPSTSTKRTSWDVTVLVADVATPDATTELMKFSTSTEPRCIAAFKGSLFLGTGDGHVLRARPQQQ